MLDRSATCLTPVVPSQAVLEQYSERPTDLVTAAMPTEKITDIGSSEAARLSPKGVQNLIGEWITERVAKDVAG
jgi:hypothetical protein